MEVRFHLTFSVTVKKKKKTVLQKEESIADSYEAGCNGTNSSFDKTMAHLFSN